MARLRVVDDEEFEDQRVEPVKELNQLADLEEGLLIEEHDLDRALLEQPDLFYRVAKIHALLQSQKDQAKQRVAEAEATADLKIRVALRKRDEKGKVTDKEVASQVRLDPVVRKAVSRLLNVSGASGQFLALKEGYEQRSYALKELCGLSKENAYSDRSYGPRDEALNRRAEANKRAMADARRRRDD